MDKAEAPASEDGAASADPRFHAGCAYIRGDIVPIAEASIPITDVGFLHSDCTYDVVSVWEGSFFRLQAHLDRFQKSYEALYLQPPQLFLLETDTRELRSKINFCRKKIFALLRMNTRKGGGVRWNLDVRQKKKSVIRKTRKYRRHS